MEDLAVRLHEKNGDDILFNMDEKINSGFYLDKINIDGKFGILRKDEKELILRCYSDKPLDDDLNGCDVYTYHFLLDLMKNGLRNLKK